MTYVSKGIADRFLDYYMGLMKLLGDVRDNHKDAADPLMNEIIRRFEKVEETANVLDDILNTYRLPDRKDGPFDLHARLNDLLECLQGEINNSIAPDMQHLMEELLQCAAMASRLGYAVHKKTEGATVLVGPDPRKGNQSQPTLSVIDGGKI